jgi:hypothetical protein
MGLELVAVSMQGVPVLAAHVLLGVWGPRCHCMVHMRMVGWAGD